MSIDIDKLEALAKVATPGPWHKGAYGGIYEGGPGQNKPGIGQCRFRDGSARANGDNNEGFIASANPSAILALITRMRGTEQREQALAAHLERWKEWLSQDPNDDVEEWVDEGWKLAGEGPETSLARLKAQCRAEALETFADQSNPNNESEDVIVRKAYEAAEELRNQYKEPTQ